MHVPYWAAPVVQRVPYVVTVHDVIPLALPAYRGSTAMRVYLSLVSRAARRARLILTDSEHARRDIIARLGASAGNVLTIPLAAGDQYRPPRDGEAETSEAALRAKFGLHKPFIFNVGGLDLRKRLDVLVEGFALALPQLHDEVELAIAGSAHTGNSTLYPSLEPLLRRLGVTKRVRLLGFVSEDDKRALFWSAEAYAFTSEYEGFGLSPLEAMACGAPVICSNRTSLPEVVGDAGVLVDPTPRNVAAALVRVLNDAPLRRQLAAAGLTRARSFSWERTADATVAAYRRAVGDASLSGP
jgi:glycosyltransferase involved in cell wall biosynthesis